MFTTHGIRFFIFVLATLPAALVRGELEWPNAYLKLKRRQ